MCERQYSGRDCAKVSEHPVMALENAGAGHPSRSTGLAAGNLAWLLPTSRNHKAIVVSPSDDALADALRLYFSEVVHLEARTINRFEQLAGSETDLLVISRLEECSPASGEWLRSVLSNSRLTLSATGCVLVTLRNPYWWSHMRSRAGSTRGFSARQVRVAMRCCGLRPVGEYYLQPYPGPPESIIPAMAATTSEAERLEHMSSGLGRARRFVARLGMHAVLYPGLACVGCL